MKKSAFIAFVFALAPWAAAQPARSFHLSFYHVGFWVRDIAKERAFYHDYLGFDEPYDLHYATGKLQMVVMKVNERQVIYLFPNAAKILPNGDNLDHLGLACDDLNALHDWLAAHGVKVGKPNRGHIGDLILGIRDPDGHVFEATQFLPGGQLLKHQGMGLAPGRISSHLLSATLEVKDLAASLHFYCDILGFARWGEAASDGAVRIRFPDSRDFLVLRPVAVVARSLPEYTLAVPDLDQAARTLARRSAATGFAPPSAPAPSAFGRQEISVVDPDGTKVDLQQE